MISKEILSSKVQDIGDKSIQMNVSLYKASDFVNEESEQSLYIYTLNQSPVVDKELFILQALVSSGINPEYLDEDFFNTFHFQEVDPVMAKEIVEEVAADLILFRETDLADNVSECTILVNEWNYICVYLEKPGQSVVLIWETSA